MVVTIEERRVNYIPMELESQLKLEPCCVTCHTTDSPLRKCSNCKLVVYCCKECQAQDWERHKREDECAATKKVRRSLEEREAWIRANSDDFAGNFQTIHGTDTFLGREGSTDDVIELLAGRFGDTDVFDRNPDPYVNFITELFTKAYDAAGRHQTQSLWETALELALEINRLTHVALPGLIDEVIPCILLKLHRDDDATMFIHHGACWSPQPPFQSDTTRLTNSTKGEWPYPMKDDCRYFDWTNSIRSCEFPDGRTWFPVTCCLILLTSKLRYIAVYENRSMRANVFLESPVAQSLPEDIRTAVESFVTGGRGRRAIHLTQMEYANLLMDYIDEKYPHILPAVLDASRLPVQQEGEEDNGQSCNVREFLAEYGDGTPIIGTLERILNERDAESEN